MAARLFQSILLEIKEKVPFMVGVVDQTGNIISCTEIKLIGDTIESASAFFASGREAGEFGGYTFQLLNGYENGIEYAVFCANRGSMADTVCALTAVAISNSKSRQVSANIWALITEHKRAFSSSGATSDSLSIETSTLCPDARSPYPFREISRPRTISIMAPRYKRGSYPFLTHSNSIC